MAWFYSCPAPEKGSGWQIKYMVRQPDNQWSEAVLLDFLVVFKDSQILEVEICPAGKSSVLARLAFDLEKNYLTSVSVFQQIRGQQSENTILISDPSPVYPMFSTLPYFSPVFGPVPEKKSRRLYRSVNGAEMIPEVLVQKTGIARRSAIVEHVSAAFSTDMEKWLPQEEGIEVVVEKNASLVFRQFWFPGLPWAVYTESEDVRAWMEPNMDGDIK